mmetsp:Transcript_3788/g.10545  ORF Transcript_3788/g.10545 Transcript_3788/m.10545 type:complete len:205 (-) Transcript_3788:701-1315(-)
MLSRITSNNTGTQPSLVMLTHTSEERLRLWSRAHTDSFTRPTLTLFKLSKMASTQQREIVSRSKSVCTMRWSTVHPQPRTLQSLECACIEKPTAMTPLAWRMRSWFCLHCERLQSAPQPKRCKLRFKLWSVIAVITAPIPPRRPMRSQNSLGRAAFCRSAQQVCCTSTSSGCVCIEAMMSSRLWSAIPCLSCREQFSNTRQAKR